MFNMCYNSNFPPKVKAEISIDEGEVNLRQLFSNFVEMTRIMGFQAESWERLIDDLYGSCVLHVDSAESYDVFLYALDTVDISKFV